MLVDTVAHTGTITQTGMEEAFRGVGRSLTLLPPYFSLLIFMFITMITTILSFTTPFAPRRRIVCTSTHHVQTAHTSMVDCGLATLQQR